MQVRSLLVALLHPWLLSPSCSEGIVVRARRVFAPTVPILIPDFTSLRIGPHTVYRRNPPCLAWENADQDDRSRRNRRKV